MKLLLLLPLALVLAGCSTVSGERQLPDGSILKVRTHRFLWSSEGIEATTKDQQGFEFTLRVLKSNPNVEAMKAIAEGAAQGAAKGVKPL